MRKQSVKARSFIEVIIKVCETFQMSLGHQDFHGAFIIEDIDERNFTWLRDAEDKTSQPDPSDRLAGTDRGHKMGEPIFDETVKDDGE